RNVASLIHVPKRDELVDIEIEMQVREGKPDLWMCWHTAEDDRPRPLALHRMLVPWAVRNPKLEAVTTERQVPEMEGGSWARGRKVFFGEKAACAKCHTVHGQGGGIGPDLSNLVHRDYQSVLRDIADPSYAINPDHITYRVDLLDGRTLTGSIRTQGERIQIGDANGKITSVNRADVESMTASTKSIMPEGLPNLLGADRPGALMPFLLPDPPHMPRDHPGPPPPPRTRAEVRNALAGAPDPPLKTRPIRIVLVAGRKDH